MEKLPCAEMLPGTAMPWAIWRASRSSGAGERMKRRSPLGGVVRGEASVHARYTLNQAEIQRRRPKKAQISRRPVPWVGGSVPWKPLRSGAKRPFEGAIGWPFGCPRLNSGASGSCLLPTGKPGSAEEGGIRRGCEGKPGLATAPGPPVLARPDQGVHFTSTVYQRLSGSSWPLAGP